MLADSGFLKNQGGVKSKVSVVFKDFKFKVPEGFRQNWSFPVSDQAIHVSFARKPPEILNLKYQWNTVNLKFNDTPNIHIFFWTETIYGQHC